MTNRSRRCFQTARSAGVTGMAASSSVPRSPRGGSPGQPYCAGSAGRLRRSPEAVGDGEAAVLAEGAAGDLGAGRGLAALVLGPVDQADDLSRGVAVEALGHQLVEAGVVLDVGLQDRVQQLVRR